MKKPAVTLKLHGKPFDPHPPAPSVIKIIRFLDKAPKDELFLSDDLSRRIGMSMKTMRMSGFSVSDTFHPYSQVVGKYRYWGHPEAIATLRAQVEAGQ